MSTIPVENVEDILPPSKSPSPSSPQSIKNQCTSPNLDPVEDDEDMSLPPTEANSRVNSPIQSPVRSPSRLRSKSPSNLPSGVLPPGSSDPSKPADPKQEQTQKKWWHGYRNTLDPRKDEVPIQVALLSALGEFIGTFLFVFYATSVVVASTYLLDNQGGASNTLIIAFGQGFSLALSIYVVAPVSGGHLNPAVTISVFVVQRITLLRAIMYIIAQFVGAIAASAVTYAIYPAQYRGNLGSTVVNPEISLAGAFFLEVIMTFMLVFVMFGTAIDPRGVGKLAPLAIGLVVLIDELIGASFTGASMNPARTLGPDLISNTWDHYWLYLFAPIIGAVIAAVMYEQYLGTFDRFRSFLPHQRARSLRRKRRREWLNMHHERSMKRRAERLTQGKEKKRNRHFIKTSLSRDSSDTDSVYSRNSDVYPEA